MTLEASDRIATITLERPDAGNALDLEMTRELRDQVRQALADPFVDILLLKGAGEDFCVGSDTAAAEESSDPTTHVFELAAALDDLFGTLDQSSKPIIVGVRGLAAGSGLGLVLAGDLALCTAGATFEVAPRGGPGAPDAGLAWLLPRAIGQQRALSFALGRQSLDAERAQDWGIATVVGDDDLDERLRELAETLGGEHLWASGEMRRLLRTSWDTSRQDLSQSEAVVLVRALLNRATR